MAYVVIAFCFALSGGIVGRLKGSSFALWFLISGLVPVLGLLAAVAYRRESDELQRLCPRCGSVIKLYDTVCMRCGLDLEFPADDALVAPEAVQRRVARS